MFDDFFVRKRKQKGESYEEKGMGHPLRDRDPSIYRIVTLRTVAGELWLPPTRSNEKLIGGIVARYQELLSIELYSYKFLGNHYHVLLRAPEANADEFMENVNREISRRLNWSYRREGKLWGRRYSEQEVLTEEDLLEAFLYINTNCTRHGLLRDSRRWKGLNSYSHVLNETDRKFHFYHYSKREHGVPARTTHKLRISVLPQFRELSKGKRKKKIAALLEQRQVEIIEQRVKSGQGFLGQELIDEQQPGAAPRVVSKSPRPVCYTKCPKALREFLKARRLLLEKYRIASMYYRSGEVGVEFPEYTFKPPLHRLPRKAPFTPLEKEELKFFA